jgi:translation initiation factor 2B subunit (eIF-2B alpha/beta/delta family)
MIKRGEKKKRIIFNKICLDIKSIKIQGATNVARYALKAYSLFPNEKTKKILLSLRPTEPLLSHIIHQAGKKTYKEILSHLKNSQDVINNEVFKLIHKDYVIFTHCHSTNVIKSLIYSKNNGKHFEVYNTETRPLFQGRKTARELIKRGISVTNFVDSAMRIALSEEQDKEENTKKVDIIFLGADALLDDYVINKVGSGVIAQLAHDYNIPVYIVADSWKYAHKTIKLEQRNFKEVWGEKKIHVKNPAFESIPKKFIKGIISEYGLLKYNDFLKKIKENTR